MLSFFPRDVLDEIVDLIGSVFLGFSYLLLCLVCFHLLIYIKRVLFTNILNKQKVETIEKEYFWGYAQISCLFLVYMMCLVFFLCMCGQKREKGTSDKPNKYLKFNF